MCVVLPHPGLIQDELDTEISFISSRGFFLSKQGYIGLARYDVREGDKSAYFTVDKFLLSCDRRGDIMCSGKCYIHGLTDGEGMRYPIVWQDFALR